MSANLDGLRPDPSSTPDRSSASNLDGHAWRCMATVTDPMATQGRALWCELPCGHVGRHHAALPQPGVPADAAIDWIDPEPSQPPARELTNPADLDALPRGSAVLTRNGRVWQKAVTATTEWWPALSGWEKPATSEQLLGMGIVTVLHIPAEGWLRFVPIEEATDGE